MNPVAITPWHWVGFILCVLFFLALDLGVFHRGAHVVRFKEALAWTTFWFALAMLFAGAIAHERGPEEAVQFATGYVIELSLSLDNVLSSPSSSRGFTCRRLISIGCSSWASSARWSCAAS